MDSCPADTKAYFCQPEGSKPTILLVEDEAVVREVTRAVLERAGYQVLECSGPQEALRLGTEHRGRIELLLSDVVMPGGMNGAELAQRLQSLQPGLVTVFMSGYADHYVLHKVTQDAMATFLQKPFTIDVLLSGVAKALQTPQNASAAAELPGLSVR